MPRCRRRPTPRPRPRPPTGRRRGGDHAERDQGGAGRGGQTRRHSTGRCRAARRCTSHATDTAGSASRSDGSARISVGKPVRLHHPLTAAAAAGLTLTVVKAAAVSPHAQVHGCRTPIAVRPTVSSSGATTSPATSLSLPVTTPGHACLSRWSFSTSMTRLTTDTGEASARSDVPARSRMPTASSRGRDSRGGEADLTPDRYRVGSGSTFVGGSRICRWGVCSSRSGGHGRGSGGVGRS